MPVRSRCLGTPKPFGAGEDAIDGSITEHFRGLDDPRRDQGKQHGLTEVTASEADLSAAYWSAAPTGGTLIRSIVPLKVKLRSLRLIEKAPPPVAGPS